MKPRSTLSFLLVLGLAGCVGATPFALGDCNAAAPITESAPASPTSAEASGTVQLPADYNPARSLAPLVDKLSPAVVFIEVESKVEVRHPQIPDQLAPFFGFQVPDSEEPQFRTKRGAGSGFIISSDGFVLTNNHVVDDADKVTITLADKRKFDGKVIGTDPRTDVALVKIDTDEALPVVPLGSSDDLRVGDWVVAIGNPFGLSHTVTAGIVSAKGRVIGAGPYDDFIQTDASINPGNSGGPLFNLNGQVVGINTAIVPGGQGIGFSVPIDMVEQIIDELKSDGSVARGWMGAGLQPMDPVLAEQLGTDKGVVISAVYPDNPAAEAGLAPGDVVTAVDGEDVVEAEDVIRAIGNKKPGETVRLGIIRDGHSKTIKVRLDSRPDEEDLATGNFGRNDHGSRGSDSEEGTVSAAERYGFRVADRRDLGSKSEGGVVVTATVGDSPAGRRLKVGDVIQEINRKRITHASQVDAALAQSEKGAMLVVQRDGTQTLVSLPAPDDDTEE